MRKLIAIIVIFVVLVASFYIAKYYFTEKPFAIRINQFTMTKDEFEDYFKEMNVGRKDSSQVRKDVLDALISKKLILQEAEKEGLNKSREFLNSLQHYYEQLLFKLIIDLKSKELASQVKVSDKEINDKYNQMIKNNLTNKPLTEIYSQIQWQILRKKQARVLDSWLEEIRKKSKVEIKEKLLLEK